MRREKDASGGWWVEIYEMGWIFTMFEENSLNVGADRNSSKRHAPGAFTAVAQYLRCIGWDREKMHWRFNFAENYRSTSIRSWEFTVYTKRSGDGIYKKNLLHLREGSIVVLRTTPSPTTIDTGSVIAFTCRVRASINLKFFRCHHRFRVLKWKIFTSDSEGGLIFPILSEFSGGPLPVVQSRLSRPA